MALIRGVIVLSKSAGQTAVRVLGFVPGIVSLKRYAEKHGKRKR